MVNSLKEYIHKLRRIGGIVNKMILISAAYDVVEHYNRSLLKKYGVLGIKSCLGLIIHV